MRKADCTLWFGTYNLNGRSPGGESLLPWLFPRPGLITPRLAVTADPRQKSNLTYWSLASKKSFN
jgi:hypothetical protein